MAANVVWLDQARDDISELIDYLFPKNPVLSGRRRRGASPALRGHTYRPPPGLGARGQPSR